MSRVLGHIKRLDLHATEVNGVPLVESRVRGLALTVNGLEAAHVLRVIFMDQIGVFCSAPLGS